jgi:hypothetical protein
VKAVGTNAIFLEDNANPTGGFSATDYQTLSNTFDSQIYPRRRPTSAQPTDMDSNGPHGHRHHERGQQGRQPAWRRVLGQLLRVSRVCREQRRRVLLRPGA